jgi:hypothetical protein
MKGVTPLEEWIDKRWLKEKNYCKWCRKAILNKDSKWGKKKECIECYKAWEKREINGKSTKNEKKLHNMPTKSNKQAKSRNILFRVQKESKRLKRKDKQQKIISKRNSKEIERKALFQKKTITDTKEKKLPNRAEMKHEEEKWQYLQTSIQQSK